jgi:glutathione peroxidase-family protein
LLSNSTKFAFKLNLNRYVKGVLMNKVKVNGTGASPVFNFLKAKSKTGAVMVGLAKHFCQFFCSAAVDAPVDHRPVWAT